MSRLHLDNDFLVHALAHAGPERQRLSELVESEAVLEMSSIAWYEFRRGPRTPEQVAVARTLFDHDGIVPFTEEMADLAARQFERLGRPRRRAADIAIGVMAVARGGVLITRNARDFRGIDG